MASPDLPLIHPDGRVLAALDTSAYATSVAAHAAWAAARLDAPLELLHVIDRPHGQPAGTDLTGSLALGDQEALLQELANLDAQRGQLAQAHARAVLEAAATQAAGQAGRPAPATRLRQGGLLDTLLELEPGVRLFVIGKRGEHADFAKGHLGGHLERVVRAVHRPVLVASRAFRPIARVLLAFDGSDTSRRAVAILAASPLLRGLPIGLLLAGEPDAARREALAQAEATLLAAGFEVRSQVLPGAPEAVLAAAVREQGVDLLVMGAYGHSRIRSLVLGSTTTAVLRSCPVPVLLLR